MTRPRPSSFMLLLTALFLSAVGLLLVAWWGQPWIVQMALAIPLILAALVWIPTSLWWGFQWTFRQPVQKSRTISLVVMVMMSEMGAALLLNWYWFDRAAREARAYPEKVAPFMKDYFFAHHRYPEKWEELPEVPRLLRGAGAYSSQGATYGFRFPDPDVPWDEWNYSSETREWEVLN